MVFHLYISDNDFENNIFYKIHYNCLKYYIDIFDEVIFYLTVDDINNRELINRGFYWISDICRNVVFSVKVKENKIPYESDTFYKEIVEKRHTYEGVVFFAHSKNCTCYLREENQTTLIHWLIALYFYSLNFIQEMEELLYGKRRPSEIFYGPLLTQLRDVHSSPMLRMNKGNCFYQGTFFWININKFNNYIDRGVRELPKLDDRYWTEMLPGTIGGRYKYGDGCTSHRDVAITDEFNLYAQDEENWRYLINVLGDSDDFWLFHEKILNDSEKFV